MRVATRREPPPPFACTYTPNVPELLRALGCSLALSTYQAGKVIVLSAAEDEKLVQLPRTFAQAMAMVCQDGRLALATRSEVIVFADAPGLAPRYPKQPDTYDALFVPRATYHTGHIDIHGLSWGRRGLYAVNTLFSCLCLVDDAYSFRPVWKPPFITALAPEDRCHLNGAVFQDGEPRYVTAFGTGDGAQSWRGTIPGGGVVIDVTVGEIVARDLPMPHSPQLWDGVLHVLLSATGELARVDPTTGGHEVLKGFDGFARGMTRYGDYVFVCMSRLRKSTSVFRDLPIAGRTRSSGLIILHRPTLAVVGRLEYHASVDEIFDIQVLPGMRRPGILNTEDTVHRLSLATPEATYWARGEETSPGG